MTSALIYSRVDSAWVVWHNYGKAGGLLQRIQRVDNIYLELNLGVFRTHLTVFLRHKTFSPPACARLETKVDSAILSLLYLPDSK